jgi:hypothetical protein
VELEARGGNRRALGARLRLEWEGGTRSAEVRSAGSFQAAVPERVHFGLGTAERARRLTIQWPGGRVQTLEDLAADRVLRIVEPEEDS